MMMVLASGLATKETLLQALSHTHVVVDACVTSIMPFEFTLNVVFNPAELHKVSIVLFQTISFVFPFVLLS